jgi:hypothetical protein
VAEPPRRNLNPILNLNMKTQLPRLQKGVENVSKSPNPKRNPKKSLLQLRHLRAEANVVQLPKHQLNQANL